MLQARSVPLGLWLGSYAVPVERREEFRGTDHETAYGGGTKTGFLQC